MTFAPLGAAFTVTRRLVQFVGVHVMARARHGLTGRIDLAPTPGGFGTPAFGTEHRVIRVDGPSFIVESTGEHPSTSVMRLRDATLRGLATFTGIGLDDDFSVGHDTPALGDVDAPLEIDGDSVRVLGDWFAFGAQVLDTVISSLPASAEPGRARIWPEHFDLGTDVGTRSGRRVNLGASPGDDFDPMPYLYVGPHEDDRPGEGDYWTTPFGAVITHDHLASTANARSAAAAFMLEGIGRFD